ncbi:phage tail length tape measure family protein [Paraburkholderia phymatum]|uniref:phage tail length tape measure family protein n=1 Tax=Paraburkholderia phymatum TaxID=148447 RepID=UPI003176E4E3
MSVDATEARKGFSDVKDAARDMAQSVTTQGAAAGKAIDSVGSGGAASAQKVESATRSMIQSIQRTTAVMEAGSKSSSAYFEALAGQRGIPTDALAPYLAALDAAKKKQDEASESMHSFSLNSTRARTELVVLGHELLQGNFSRFGSSLMVMAEATDALSIAMSPLGVAIGVSAAAIGALAVAAYKGHQESEQLRNSLVLTGNAAGMTANSFSVMARAIADSTGQGIGTAREALQGLVSTGQLSGQALQLATEDVVTFAKLSGESTDKVAADYAKMADGVTKWATEHNKQLNYMTEADYERVKSLEDAGKTEQALMDNLSLLHQHFADVADEKLGYVERAWKAVKGSITDTWDALKAIGRDQTPEEQLQAIADKRKRSDSGGITSSWEDPRNVYTAQDDADAMALQMQADKSAVAAFAKAQADADQKAGIAAADSLDKAMHSFDKAYAKKQELDQRKAEFVKLFKSNPSAELLKGVKITGSDETGFSVSGGAYDSLVADINKRYTDKPKSPGLVDKTQMNGEVQAVKDALTEELSAVASAQKQLDSLYKSGGLTQSAYYQQSRDLIAQKASDEIDAYNKEASILSKGLADRGLNAQQRAQINNQIQQDQAKASKATEDFFNAIAESAAKEDEVWDQYGQKQLDAMQKQIDAAHQQDQSLKDQIDTFGMGKSAIDELKASRADDTVAALEQGKATALLNNNLADTKPWDDAIAKAKELSKALHGVADDQAVLDQKEAAKKIADQAVQDWKSAANSIENGITNALMNGFNNGKSFGQQLADSLKAMFKTLILQPIIAPIAGGVASFMYPGAAQAYAQTNPNSPLVGNPLGSLSSLANSLPGINNMVGSAANLFGGFSSSTAASLANAEGGDVLGNYLSLTGNAGSSGATSSSIPGAGGVPSDLGAVLGAAGTGFAVGSLFGGTGAKVGGTAGALAGSLVLPGIGTLIGSALGGLVGSLFGGGETRYGASYASDASGNLTKFAGPSGGDPAASQTMQQITSTFSTIQQMASALGGDISGLGQYKASYEVSPKKGNSFVSAGFTTGADWYPDKTDLGGVKDSQTVLNDFSLQLQRSIIESLQEANLDAPYAKVLQGVNASQLSSNDVTSLINELNTLKSLFDSIKTMGADFNNLKGASADAQLAVINLSGGVSQFATNANYFEQHFVPASEQVANQAKAVTDQLAAMGMSSVQTNDQFRAVVQGLDLSTASGQQLYAQMLALAPAFDQMTQAAKAAADAQQSLWNSYFSAIYTPDQQLAMNTKQLKAQFDALGVAMPKTNAEFQALVENMDTSDPKVKALQNSLLALAPAFGQVMSAADQAAQQAQQAAQQSLQTALSNVQTAYNNQVQAIQSNIDSINQFITSLTSLKQSLALGDLSTLSPQDKYNAEKQLFEQTSAKAMAGDATAQGQLPQVAQDFLNASKAFNASSQAYVDDYNEVQSALDQNIATAQQQLSAAQQQLDATKQEVQGILNLNQTVQSLSDALKEYFAAQLAAGQTPSGSTGSLGDGLDYTQSNGIVDFGSSGGHTISSGGGITFTGVSDDQLSQIGQQVAANIAWNNQIDQQVAAAGVDYTDFKTAGDWGTYETAVKGAVLAGASLVDAMAQAASASGAHWINGSHAGGADYIPFDGYRAELHKGEAVITSANNQKLSQILNIDWSKYGRGDNAALIAEIQSLRDEVAQLKGTVATVGAAQYQQSEQQHAENRADMSKQTRHLQTVGDNTGRLASK